MGIVAVFLYALFGFSVSASINVNNVWVHTVQMNLFSLVLNGSS